MSKEVKTTNQKVAEEAKEESGGFKLNYPVMVTVILLIALVFYRGFISSPRYMFSIDATTEVLRLEIDPEVGVNRWRTKGAVICSRTELDLLLVPEDNGICGGRRWKAYYSDDPEQFIEISSTGVAVFRSTTDGGLRLSLRGTDAKASIGKIIHENGSKKVEIGAQANVLWLAEPVKEVNDSGAYGVYPFTGITTIGEDINYASTGSLMKTGNVRVFTSDSTKASGRKELSGSELVLGDQVSLYSSYEGLNPVSPRGFVYHRNTGDSFNVVVHGIAEEIQVNRYGDDGYIYKPGWFPKLLNDPVLKVWVPILMGIFGVVTALTERKN